MKFLLWRKSLYHRHYQVYKVIKLDFPPFFVKKSCLFGKLAISLHRKSDV